MHFKSEFRRRLLRLLSCLTSALTEDHHGTLKLTMNGLLPAFFSVFMYICCKRPSDLIKN